jgi:hypothetical protein
MDILRDLKNELDLGPSPECVLCLFMFCCCPSQPVCILRYREMRSFRTECTKNNCHLISDALQATLIGRYSSRPLSREILYHYSIEFIAVWNQMHLVGKKTLSAF